jgi:hypothetical protein
MDRMIGVLAAMHDRSLRAHIPPSPERPTRTRGAAAPTSSGEA